MDIKNMDDFKRLVEYAKEMRIKSLNVGGIFIEFEVELPRLPDAATMSEEKPFNKMTMEELLKEEEETVYWSAR